MSRQLRYEVENGCYHISHRARRAFRLCRDDDDYLQFVRTLQGSADRFEASIFSYLVTQGGYQLLIRTRQPNLSRVMRQINGQFAQYLHRKYRSDGAVFRGRYRSVYLEEGAALLRRSRELHLDAIAVKDAPLLASSWPLFDGRRRSWIDRDALISLLDAGATLADYRNYVLSGESAPCGDTVLEVAKSIEGSPEFVAQAMDGIEDISEEIPFRKELSPTIPPRQVVAVVALHCETEQNHILEARRGRYSHNMPRLMAMYLCQQVGQSSLKQIADYFSLGHYASAANSISKFRSMVGADAFLASRVDTIQRQLLLGRTP